MEPQAADLPYLLMRSSVLKRQLVDYAKQPRFGRRLTPRLAEATSPDGTLEESTLIDVLDEFIMRYRFPGGGIFEVVRTDDEASILLNLIDELEYRVHFNTGATVADLGTGVAADARHLPLPEQTKAFRQGVIPYIPALGRDGTAEWLVSNVSPRP
jgi:hypothetical protein